MKYSHKNFVKVAMIIANEVQYCFQAQWAYEESWIKEAIKKGDTRLIEIQLRSSNDRLEEIRCLRNAMMFLEREITREEQELDTLLKQYDLLQGNYE